MSDEQVYTGIFRRGLSEELEGSELSDEPYLDSFDDPYVDIRRFRKSGGLAQGEFAMDDPDEEAGLREVLDSLPTEAEFEIATASASRSFFFRLMGLVLHDQPQENALGRTLLVVHWRRRRIVVLGTRGALFGAGTEPTTGDAA